MAGGSPSGAAPQINNPYAAGPPPGAQGGSMQTPKYGSPTYVGGGLPQASSGVLSGLQGLQSGGQNLQNLLQSFGPALLGGGALGQTGYNPAQTTQIGNALSNQAMGLLGRAGSLINNPLATQLSGLPGQAQGMINPALGLFQLGRQDANIAQRDIQRAQNIVGQAQQGYFAPQGGAMQQMQALNAQSQQPLDPSLIGYAQQALQQGFDPQGALKAQQMQQLTDQLRAQEAAAGIAMTPYGAGVTGQVLGQFDLNWLNEQMQREQAAAQTAGGLYTTAEQQRMLPATLAQMLGGEQSQWQNMMQGLAGTQAGLGTAAGQLGQMATGMGGTQIGAASTMLGDYLNALTQPVQAGGNLLGQLGGQAQLGQGLAQAGPNYQQSLLSNLLSGGTTALNPLQSAIGGLEQYLTGQQGVQQQLSGQNITGQSAIMSFLENMQRGGSSGKNMGGVGNILSGVGSIAGPALGKGGKLAMGIP